MSISFNILILNQDGNIPSATQRALQKAGHTTRNVENLAEAGKQSHNLEHSVLILDCGSSQDQVIPNVKALIAENNLKDQPILLIGQDVDSVERIIDKHCVLSLTLNIPAKVSDINQAIDYFLNNYKPSKKTAKKEPKQVVQETSPEAAKQTLIRELDQEIDSIPDILFNQLENLNLIENEIGGSDYAFRADSVTESELNLDLVSKTVVNEIKSMLADSAKWGRMHLYRVALISNKISKPLDLSENTLRNIQAASYLFAWSFSSIEPELLKKSYDRSDKKILKKDLCSKIKDSAMKVATELGNSELSKLIATIGRYIGDEEPVGEDELAIAASIVMTADLTDRVCYQSGSWNSRSAYHLMKRLKSGSLKEIHPQVWGCIIKFLSEAIVAKQSACLLPKRIRENPRLLKRAKRNRESAVNENEVKVPLSVLVPGMRLSRPLFAFDGKKILPDDIILDGDLIWRIWQLSAVRPLNSPVIVKNDESWEFVEEK